jgi:hypothetical protein
MNSTFKKSIVFILFFFLLVLSVSAVDLDGDNIDDSVDNCVNAYNPFQIDPDFDGFGNACDPTPVCDYNINCYLDAPFNNIPDSDCDGIPDASDPCMYDADQGVNFQGDIVSARNLDGDEYFDSCDANYTFNSCSGYGGNGGSYCDPTGAITGIPDFDCDGVPDASDNCPEIYNPGQEDNNGYQDGYGAGDACEQINVVPEFYQNISTQIWDEDTNKTLNLSNHFRDPNPSEQLTYVFEIVENISIEIVGNIVTFEPDKNWNSLSDQSEIRYLSFNATDSEHIVYSNQFALIVTPVNDVPMWTLNISNVSLNQDFGVVTPVNNLLDYVYDADNDSLIFSIVDETLGAVNCDINGQILTLNSVQNWFGTTSCTVEVNDQNGGTANKTFSIEVNQSISPPNSSISLNLPESINFTENTSMILNLNTYVFNPDNYTLSWSFSGNSNILVNIDSSNVANFSSSNWAGYEIISFTVRTSLGAEATDSLNVTVDPVILVLDNVAPTWDVSLGDITLNEDFTAFVLVNNLNGFVSDFENDSLTFRISQEDNSQVNCEINGAQLILRSVLNWNGDASCSIEVDDGHGGVVVDILNVHVNPIQDSPILTAIPDMNAFENTLFNYQVQCVDPDGDMLSYSDNSNLFSISNSGLISFIPVLSDQGIYNLNITCSDGTFLVADYFVLSVSSDPRAPTINGANLIAYVNQRFSYQVNAVDLNGDNLIFSDNINLFNINSSTGLIEFVPVYSDKGTYTFIVTVFDGTFNVEQTYNLRVLDYAPALCSDGLDNDNDGLTDYPDDLGCESPSDNDEFNLKNNVEQGVKIVKTNFYGIDYNTVVAGDYVLVSVTLQNYIDEDLEGVAVGIILPESGIKEIIGTVDIDSGERKTVKSFVYIPEDSELGDFYAGAYVSTSDIKRTKYVPIRII